MDIGFGPCLIDDHVSDIFTEMHNILACALLGAAVLHILGAIKHRLIDKDPNSDVLSRML